nr:hypothetical protein [Sodalis praecaptivus]
MLHDPEHAAHLWLNHATVLTHEAEHDVKHWKHQIHVNQENKHSLCLLQHIDEARMTRAIDDLTNSEIIYHDRLMQRDRARFIYDAAKNKLARVRQERQDKAHEETRRALLMSQNVVANKNVEPVLTTDSLSDKFRFLSTSQLSLKAKELASAPTLSQQIATQTHWASIETMRIMAYAGGMLASIPVSLYNAVDSIVKAGMDYENTLKALKDLANSGNILGNIAESYKESWRSHFDAMSTAQEQGTAAGFFKAGLEGATPIVDLASIVMGGTSAVKAGSKAIEAGINLSENILKKSTHWSSQYPTVKIEEISMKWGGNIKFDQGDPFEKFVGNKYFSKSTRTPDTFKTFDYFDEATGSAVSVKTLNTLSNSKINDPKRIYSSIKNNIDDTIKFQLMQKMIFNSIKTR